MGTYTFHDAESHGTVDMSASQILAQSSNLGTIEIAQQLGENPLLAQIANLGFGSPTGLDFPGESAGIVPGASNWTGTSIGSTPIGQDDAVTAQQVLDAYNAVANGGVFVAPSLIRGTITPSGATTLVKKPATRRVISPAVDAELVPMLEGVVQSGTGTEAAIDGYTVAGKTGTAQIPNPDKPGYIRGAYMGSFAGFAPGPVSGRGPRPSHTHLRRSGGRTGVLDDHGLCPAPLWNSHLVRWDHRGIELRSGGHG
jgi:cell division protein FtsI (penicillin-binding protein 3)